jgi:hypothetical protein
MFFITKSLNCNYSKGENLIGRNWFNNQSTKETTTDVPALVARASDLCDCQSPAMARRLK